MKYLIDDDLRDRLLTILTVTERWNTRNKISELKPIEPLSDQEIADAMLEPVCCLTKYDREFARAIEAHILGERE